MDFEELEVTPEIEEKLWVRPRVTVDAVEEVLLFSSVLNTRSSTPTYPRAEALPRHVPSARLSLALPGRAWDLVNKNVITREEAQANGTVFVGSSVSGLSGGRPPTGRGL